MLCDSTSTDTDTNTTFNIKIPITNTNIKYSHTNKYVNKNPFVYMVTYMLGYTNKKYFAKQMNKMYSYACTQMFNVLQQKNNLAKYISMIKNKKIYYKCVKLYNSMIDGFIRFTLGYDYSLFNKIITIKKIRTVGTCDILFIGYILLYIGLIYNSFVYEPEKTFDFRF